MDPDLAVLRRELAGRSVTEREEYYDRRNLSPEDRDRIEALLPVRSDPTSGDTFWGDPTGGGKADAPTTLFDPKPQTLGRYQLIRLLGRGGMGEVYLARDPILDRDIALKVLGGQFDDADARKRLVREARAAGRLRHPNIVTVFDAGEENGRSYIAMEYVPGETLGGLIRRRAPLSIARKLELIEGAAAGLAHAHRISVIHLDIKPDNLILDESAGALRVLDFGIARVLRSEAEVTRSVAGTLRYMSPEQLQGRQIDRRSDVFSLGCSLFELASGVAAFTGSTHEVVTRITSGPTPRLIEVAPEIDPRLDALVSRAMALNPEDRYGDMDILRADLGRLRDLFTESGDRVSQPLPVLSSMPGTASESRPHALTETVPARPLKRLALWAGVCLLVGFTGALGFWIFSRDRTPAVANSDPTIVTAAPAAPALIQPAPSPVVPKVPEKPANDSDEVWRLLASGDREGVLRRLRSAGGNSMKTRLAADVADAVRGAVQKTRLAATDRSATESASYRLGEERLAQANRLADGRQPVDALGAFWEADDLYRQSVRPDLASAQIPTIRQFPVAPPETPPAVASRPPQSAVQASRPEPSTSAPPIVEPRAMGRAADPAPPSRSPSDDDVILEVLRRYERAFEARNVAVLQEVFPGLAPDQVENLRKTFANLSAYEIDIGNPSVNVQNGTATVRALIARRLVPKAGRPENFNDQTEFRLRREGDSWVIVGVSGVKPSP